MTADPLTLARIQFAANISFHILFPAVSIGLGWLLLYFRIRYTLSRNELWESAYRFWVKVFALTFAMGVVSGITMSFQFGTNWPGYMETVGNVAGPLLGYEVLTAFFLEASFLGIMLFGRDRVSNRVHLISSFLVAFGTTLSAFWILSLDSWMQTPAGYRIEDGEYFVQSWISVIFNPSFPYRFAHMLLASLLTSAFLVAGVSAWRARRGIDAPTTAAVMRSGMLLAALLAPLQIFVGDLHGLNTREYQPAKIAAMEAVWETRTAVPLVLFGMPDEALQTTRWSVEIPYAASLILTHDPRGEVQGLDAFRDAHPPVAMVFWSFRIMLGIGVLMVLVAWLAAWSMRRGGLPGERMLRTLSWMTFSGWVAVLAGWYVTEIGRQPWIVDGLLLVRDVVADHRAGTMLGTLAAYLLLYVFLLTAYVGTIRYLSTRPAQSLTMAPTQSPRPAAAGG